MRKIAIIGASYLQLPLVLKAKEMGLDTLCFAWEQGAVCKDYCDKFFPISITDKEKISDICKLEKINGVISIASDLAVATMTYVAENLGLTGNTFQSSLVSTNKFLQRQVLRRNSIKVPNFEHITQPSKDKYSDKFLFPVVVKPVDCSGSKGITVVKEQKKLCESIEYAINESFVGEAIIEEFISGVEISVETISYNGEHKILALTDKITTGYPHFVELEHHQPSKFCNSELYNLIVDIVKKSLDVIGVKYGASHSELIITPNGEIYVTEIGARMGGDFIGSHLVMLSTGFDFLKAVIQIALGEKYEITYTEKKYSGVCFYSKESEWVQKYTNDHKEELLDFQINPLNNYPLKESSERSGYFIYTSKNKINFNAYKR